MTAVTQPNNIILGVYGSSNVRKDNVVEQITRKVERDMFDVIVMASVMKKNNTWCLRWNKSPDVRRIRNLGTSWNNRLSSGKSSAAYPSETLAPNQMETPSLSVVTNQNLNSSDP
ncbi:hypothetical protein JHK82_033261 [Glycine max]|nr:hypothetical protein JHK82_033261 [Glycine max]